MAWHGVGRCEFNLSSEAETCFVALVGIIHLIDIRLFESSRKLSLRFHLLFWLLHCSAYSTYCVIVVQRLQTTRDGREESVLAASTRRDV
jgi:hypothetical protein